MNELKGQLRRLAATLPREASEGVERRLLTAFRARHYGKKPWWIYLAAAACLAGVVGLYLAKPRAAASKYQDGAFLMLPYAQSGVPLEQPVVVRVNLSVSELSVMGVPSLGGSPNERIGAELLIGQDGVARAVRFVQ